ncbi:MULTISPECIES: hypothetical protein [Paraliobacillus]|uniref:hypothetical protein n=1 Tax=Paraliobacillus TaxID=200903 RepID=UPI0018E54547|nr:MULTISPECIES: hypothetical protein [Paraliobacillus]
MEQVVFFSYIYILLYVGILGFGIYFVVTLLKRSKERNEYLKEIRNEIKEIRKK